MTVSEVFELRSGKFIWQALKVTIDKTSLPHKKVIHFRKLIGDQTIKMTDELAESISQEVIADEFFSDLIFKARI